MEIISKIQPFSWMIFFACRIYQIILYLMHLLWEHLIFRVMSTSLSPTKAKPRMLVLKEIVTHKQLQKLHKTVQITRNTILFNGASNQTS